MNTIAELQALQNATNGLNLTVHIKLSYDKRKSTRYFLQRGSETVSPVLNYDQMNHFLLGYRKCFTHNVN